MSDAIARNSFGAMAFAIAVMVIAAVLSPYVPTEKEGIANLVLGNVLGWPMMVLAYHYGTNAGSARKTELLGIDTATGHPDDPVHVLEDEK